ncbi:MAG: insulinase family protein, partial [Hyphomicrobiales bacterium]|nr:insulinase family protein [Hyphomicrobiales bacterium]
LSVVGAIDALCAGRLVDAAFGPLPARGKLVAIPPTGPAGIGERRVVDVDVPSSTIRFGRPGVGRHDPDFTAAMVIAHILGGGVFSARLFKEVREKRGLAYSISASLSAGAAAAALYGGTSTKNDRAKESLDVISSEIAALGAEGPSAEELANAQAYLVGSYPLHFDTSTKIAAQLLQIQRDGFGAGWLTERNAKIEALTLPEAKRVAGRLLGDGGLAVAIAGRPEGFGSIKTTETP